MVIATLPKQYIRASLRNSKPSKVAGKVLTTLRKKAKAGTKLETKGKPSKIKRKRGKKAVKVRANTIRKRGRKKKLKLNTSRGILQIHKSDYERRSVVGIKTAAASRKLKRTLLLLEENCDKARARTQDIIN